MSPQAPPPAAGGRVALRLPVSAGVISLACFLVLAAGHAATKKELPYAKGYTVTGDYAVGNVDLRPTGGSSGFATGTIPMSGVPENADILAAFLYWETIWTDKAQVDGATFRGAPVTVVKASSRALADKTAACYASGGGRKPKYTMTMYRADVLHLLPSQVDGDGNATGKRLVNDADLLQFGLPLHSVTLPDAGAGNQVPQSAGATLVVVYRAAGAPLRKVVLFDGITLQSDGALAQNVFGFLQSSTGATSAKLTHIIGSNGANKTDQIWFSDGRRRQLLATNAIVPNGSPASDRVWAATTFDVGSRMPGRDDNDGFGETVWTYVDHKKKSPGACLSFAAVVFSTTVQDTDRDGLIDKHEDVSGLMSPDRVRLPDLRAMGANSRRADFFAEIGAMYAEPGTTYGSAAAPFKESQPQVVDEDGHTHLPTPAVLKQVGDTLLAAPIVNPDGTTGIRAHFDVGPNYHQVFQSDIGNAYLVPAAQARGGEAIKEVACVPSATLTCQFPDFPGTVSWKIGYQLYRDQPVANNGGEIPPAEQDACEVYGNCRLRFDANRRDTFRYLLYAHARGMPKSADPDEPGFHVPRSVSGVADLPGGDVMVTLGLWGDFDGTDFMVASTTVQ